MNELHVGNSVFRGVLQFRIWKSKSFVLRKLPYNQVLDVVWTHPPACREGSERRIQTVHVKQERAIVTLDQWSHSAAPVRKRQNKRPFIFVLMLTLMIRNIS